jgi:hypothetical protein
MMMNENFFGWNPKGSVWNRRFHMRAPARMTWHAKGGPAPETAHYFWASEIDDRRRWQKSSRRGFSPLPTMSKLPPNSTRYDQSIPRDEGNVGKKTEQDVIELSDSSCSHDDDCGSREVVVVGSNNAKLPAVVSPKKKKARKEITFWTLPKDVSSFLDAPGRQSARFTVRGEPQSLRRPGPRRSNFHSKCKTQGRPLFNPSRGKQQSFRKAVEGLLPARLHSSRLLFPEGARMVVTIVSCSDARTIILLERSAVLVLKKVPQEAMQLEDRILII